MELKEKLVVLRKEKGLSQLKLAEILNVSRQAVSRWEVGVAIPSTENLKYLGELYNVPLEYLLDDDVLEPACVDLKPGEKAFTSGVKKKNRRIVLVIMVIIAIFVVAVALCTILLGSEGEEPIPMEDIKGSDMITVDDFRMDW